MFFFWTTPIPYVINQFMLTLKAIINYLWKQAEGDQKWSWLTVFVCIEHADLFVGQICGNSRASVDWQSRNANWATWEDIKIFLCCTAFIYASVQSWFFYTFAFNICVIIICCWIVGDIYHTKQNWTCHWKWQTVMYDENLFYVKKIWDSVVSQNLIFGLKSLRIFHQENGDSGWKG